MILSLSAHSNKVDENLRYFISETISFKSTMNRSSIQWNEVCAVQHVCMNNYSTELHDVGGLLGINLS